MKSQLFHCLSVAAAATTLVSFTVPAQAASLSSVNFGSNGILFNTNQRVEFTFQESHGMYKSDLGIYKEVGGIKTFVKNLFSEKAPGYDAGSNDAKNDWLGSCGKTVANCTTTFDFLANTKYYLGLASQGAKTVFSNNLIATKFTYGGDSYTFNTQGPSWIAAHPKKAPTTKTISVDPAQALVAINDTDKIDLDVNDMIIKAQAVPEPGTVGALLGVGVLGLIGRHRRKGAVS